MTIRECKLILSIQKPKFQKIVHHLGENYKETLINNRKTIQINKKEQRTQKGKQNRNVERDDDRDREKKSISLRFCGRTNPMNFVERFEGEPVKNMA